MKTFLASKNIIIHYTTKYGVLVLRSERDSSSRVVMKLVLQPCDPEMQALTQCRMLMLVRIVVMVEEEAEVFHFMLQMNLETELK